MNDFFTKPEEKKEEEKTTTVKVGEKEYSQDELSQLVGLGETARDYETKWNRPISQFYPDYTQKSQKLADYERKQTEEKAAREVAESAQHEKELADKAKKNELSPEEVRQMAIREAKELGLVTKDDFETAVKHSVANALAAKDLVDDISAVLADAEEKGQPKTTMQDLAKYMDENGIKNPGKAYKLMFEDELDKWKEEKLKSIKPRSMETQTGSTAGSKFVPPAQPVTRENLAQVIRESLTRSQGM